MISPAFLLLPSAISSSAILPFATVTATPGTPLPLAYYLVVSLALLCIGIAGLLTRRNIMIVLISIELMLNAVSLNLVAFSRHWGHATGQVFSLFVIAIAVAETAVGLGLLIAFFRNRQTVQADEMDFLKW